jgi:hypothetical protein
MVKLLLQAQQRLGELIETKIMFELAAAESMTANTQEICHAN